MKGRPKYQIQARPGGPVVVVTGAGSGIGRETALAYAERSGTIVCADIDAPAAERTVELCTAMGAAAEAYVVDVGDDAAMEGLAKHVEEQWGAPDIAVNNAGIGIAGPTLAMTTADWDALLRVNLHGVILGSRLFGNQMVARGQGGHIVNIASAAVFLPSRTLSAYSTSKAAVAMFTECLRLELAEHDIGVTGIYPGVINTAIVGRTRWVGVDEAEHTRRTESTTRLYARRNYGPERVAAAILKAVDHNRALVPVSPEAHAMQWGWRLAPGLMRRLGTRDLGS